MAVKSYVAGLRDFKIRFSGHFHLQNRNALAEYRTWLDFDSVQQRELKLTETHYPIFLSSFPSQGGILIDIKTEILGVLCLVAAQDIDSPVERVNIYSFINLENLVFPMTGVPTEVLLYL